MKKNILFSMCASLLFLASCDYNEDNFPGYDELTKPKDVQSVTLTLADADYKVIADLKGNKEIALSKDPEEKSFLLALETVGKNKYFTEQAQAVWYMPAFVNEKYPYLSDGSKATVVYNNFENLPEYQKDFNGISAYDLTAEDYKSVWGESTVASYLSPSTVKQIPAILKDAVKNPTDGAMRQVNYAYSATEPSTGGGSGGGTVEPTYTNISTVLAAAGTGTYDIKGEVVAANAKSFIVKDATGSIRVYEGSRSACSVGDVVTVSGDIENKQGLNRFKSSANFALVGRSATFTYPTPAKMTAADLASYLKKLDVKYVTYEGVFTTVDNGSYKSYNVSLGNDDVVVGSIVDPLIVEDAWEGQTVVVTGYLAGLSGTKYVNTFVTSIVKKGSPTPTPVGVAALAPAGSQSVKGIVVATHTKGFMLSDGSGNILVYQNEAPDSKIGDIVSVSGTTSKRNGLMQFGNAGLVVTKEAGTVVNSGATPKAMTGEELEAYLTASRVVYASYEGILTIADSGKGYNNYSVTVAGTTTAQLAFSYADDKMISAGLNGKKVVVKGYLLEAAGTKINTMVTSVEAAKAASFRTFASTRAIDSTPTNSDVYRYDGTSKMWTKYTTAGVSVNVLQPADYALMGSAYVSKPAETLPIYLKQAHPYAKADDAVAVVYYSNSDKAIVVSEFSFDGTVWTPTTVAVPTTIVFVKTQGVWTEAKVYYSCTFLNNDAGDFVIKDVELSGLKKVWSLDAKFGWKGSGFSGGNKVTESWIVSPEISLKKSIDPVLKFDVAINYLKGAPLAEHFGVFISTNYADDVKTATWTELKVEGWPTADSWDFVSVTPTSLSAYKEQNVHIAFRYKSNVAVATTIEVKNMSIQE